MRIAIIGTGNVGSTLGQAWANKGHEVFYGTRSPAGVRTEELLKATGKTAQAGTPKQATEFGEVVVFATPWDGTEEAVKAAGNLNGKVVIDCTNPIKADLSGLEIGHTNSGGETVARWAQGAKVCKAFNTTGFKVMADPVINGVRTVMFVCGDDDSAKRLVLSLATDVGFNAIDAGELVQARLLESWAMLWIHLAINGKLGPEYGFALLRRV